MPKKVNRISVQKVLSLILGLLLLLSGAGQLTVLPARAAGMEVLYEGRIDLPAGETFAVTAYNSGVSYTVDMDTPLGALQIAGDLAGFEYDVTDKNIDASGALLLDNVGQYERKPGYWYAYVNGAYKDGFNNPAGALNLIKLTNGDEVEFYYAADVKGKEEDLAAVQGAAIAAVIAHIGTDGAAVTDTGEKTDVDVTQDDWTLQLSGAREETVSRSYFEEGLACHSSHQVFWTDEDGNEWGGVPLWLLVAMVDDDPDEGSAHYNFNDELANEGYTIDVIAGDGWKATLASADIARDDGYIIANTLNGEPLPKETPGGKDCWPLHLKGEKIFGGQQVGNIVRIELTGLPKPVEGWTLELVGKVGDSITQEEFEKGQVCIGTKDHYAEWTDNEGKVWSGTPLWILAGAVDDIEESTHWTFNDVVAQEGYTIRVEAEDGFSRTFSSQDVARSGDYIVADRVDGKPLSAKHWPLRLVGPGVTKEDGSLGGAAVGNIVKITIPELLTPAAEGGSWNLTLTGAIDYIMSQAEFEEGLACHKKEWIDAEGQVWSGMPLWYLAGWVDDKVPHDFNVNLANAGYTIHVKAEDGYTKDFASQDVAKSSDYILANEVDGEPLTESWPLRLVGDGVATDGSLGGHSVGGVATVALTDFEAETPVPEIRIIKYGEDGQTVLAEETVTYQWMEENLEVIGDGKTVYRYEGIIFDPEDEWGDNIAVPKDFKIENAVKGTRVKDLVELVGGMGAGTEIVFVAKDGWETRLPYSSIYTDPMVQERQGDAILAWYSDGEYVPDYAGIRLFFTPGGDHIYRQKDMRDTLPEAYWHYYGKGGTLLPSCAGLSAKWLAEVWVYSMPEKDWTLKLDGREIGGLEYEVSKTYWEQGLTCQFGANHKSSYTDDKGRVWEGMSLWLLAGFVDDEDQHSDHAFNTALAEAGYNILLTAADGHSVKVHSTDIIRNKDYIVASMLDGLAMSEDDKHWPLRLVGPAVSGKNSISQIVKIELLPDSDIAGHWAEESIKKLMDRGVIEGYPDGTFRPEENITRAEFAALLVKAFGLDVSGEKVFADTAGHWAQSIISTAEYHDIVSGYDEDTFGPNDPVTRQEVAVMIVQAAQLDPKANLPAFADADSISPWAKDAIARATAAGVIKGYPDETFQPQGKASRAEAVTVLVNCLG